MGGKQKQAQRTKGNVRPSSSARAAEMLEASGGAASGFIGFGALSGDLGYIPVSGGADEADTSVDADFRLTLRKLSKRDATTKMKALQEFAGLCKEKTSDDVQSVLPFWPRLYAKLSIDYDRRVRESTQHAFEQLVLRVRRNLAPHLKSVMGPWLVAQCDVYAPAATAAKSAFQAAFPPTKQTEAITFCKEDILNHLYENLLTHTAQTLSDPKTTEPEDMQAKYQRVLACSLLAWRLLMSSLAAEQQQSLSEKYGSILKDGKFWKLPKHTSNVIKSSFYSLLASLCQYNPELAQEFADKICPVVLHSLDESDPLISPNLWEAVLYTVTTIPDCWTKVNPRKGVLPKLWVMLRQGGSGCATVIYPNLLPFLSKLPSEVIGEGTGFYAEFFNNLKQGLTDVKVQASPSETAAIVQASIECIRYCLMQHLAETAEDGAIRDLIITDQLLPLLEASFVEKSSALPASPLYSLTTNMLIHLHKVTLNGADELKQQQAVKVQRSIWDALQDICKCHLAEQNSTFVLDRIGTFLLQFKNPMLAAAKKKGRVKFAESPTKTKDEGTSVKSSSVTSMEVSPSEENLLLKEGSLLSNLVCTSCHIAYMHCQNFKSAPHLSFLACLLPPYISNSVMYALQQKDDSSDLTSPMDTGISTADLASDVFKDTLLPWVTNCPPNSWTPDTVKHVTGILSSVFSLLSPDDKLNTLKHFYQDDTHAMLLAGFSHHILTQYSDPVVGRWFHGAEFGDHIVSMTKRLCEHCLKDDHDVSAVKQDTEACWALLQIALSTDKNMEPVMSVEYMDRVLMEIQQALPSAGRQTQLASTEINKCVAFVCDVAHIFYSNVMGCLSLNSAEDLLLALFKFSCQHSSVLKGSVSEKVCQTWQMGVKSLLYQKGAFINEEGFFLKAASYIKFRVLNDADTMKRLLTLTQVTMDLVEAMSDHIKDISHDTDDEDADEIEETGVSKMRKDQSILDPSVALFLSHLTMPFMHSMTTQWWQSVLISNQLCMKEIPKESGQTPLTTIPKCVAPIAFTSQILSSVCHKVHATAAPTPPEDGDAAAMEGSGDPHPDNSPVSSVLLLDVLYGIAFCQAVIGPSKGSNPCEVSQTASLLETDMRKLISHLGEDQRVALIQHALQKSFDEGDLWSLALGVVLRLTGAEQANTDIVNSAMVLTRLNCLTYTTVQTLQVVLPHIPKYEVPPIVDILASQIISLNQQDITEIFGARGMLPLLTAAMSLLDAPLGEAVPSSTTLHADSILSLLSEIQLWRETHEVMFAFDSTVKELSWDVLTFNREIMYFLQQTVSKIPSQMTDKHWDFTLCSLVAWIQTVQESGADNVLQDTTMQMFAVSASCLLREVAVCIKNIVVRQPKDFPPDLMTEWTEFFSLSAYGVFLPLFVNITSHINLSDPTPVHEAILHAVCAAVAYCPVEHIKSHSLPARLIADQETNLPDDLQTLLNHICPLLLAPHYATAVAAYMLMNRLMPELAVYDVDKGRADDNQKEEITRAPPAALLTVLETSILSLKSHIEGLRIGEHTVLAPYTEEYTFTTAYLLSWRLLLTFLKSAPSELKVEYVSYLRDSHLLDQLLCYLFSWMPENPVVVLRDALTSQPPSNKLSPARNMFTEAPPLQPEGKNSSEALQHLACFVYYTVLQELPAVARNWWIAQDRKTAETIDIFTSKYVSPVLCAEELSVIQSKNIDSENMSVRVRLTAREVVATYMVQEFSTELLVSMPPNYPLGSIGVESSKQLGVTHVQWRKWLLQITSFLTHQNGSICDGLLLWKRIVDKRFEGLDDCMICYSLIHDSNYQLPKRTCVQCKKRFHSACLYKWFNTSGNTACPMCRNTF